MLPARSWTISRISISETKKGCKYGKAIGRKKKKIIPILLVAAGLALVGISGYRLISQQLDYRHSNELYDHLRNDYVSAGTDAEPAAGEPEREQPDWAKRIRVDVKKLKEENPDCIGWVYQENSDDISYPIMYTGDDFYLRRSFDKEYATAGCIFLEGANKPDLTDSHSIVYGHNMRNLSMFGTLKYYHDEGFYKDHQYFQILTETKAMRYHIFAYSIVSQYDKRVYQVPFAPDDAFAAFIDGLYSLSEKDTGVAVTKDDKIVTFSTCSVEEGNRTVIHAVLEDTWEYPKEDEK